MPTIKLPEEAEHSEMVRKIDAMLRDITKAPAMTQSARAQGLRPQILMVTQAELTHVMASRTILNQQKRMLALAVAAARSAPYELYAHTHALQREYGMSTSEIVELVATIAHVTAINMFESAIAAFKDVAPMRALELSTPVLAQVRQKLGEVPRYFQYMASDPQFCQLVLDREVATIHEGDVSRVNKELVAFGTSLVNGALYSIGHRAETLRQLGMTNEQLFEATTAVTVFVKNAAFSTGLQLEPVTQ
ncbi:MAG TPA: carboxymuconolactone decarboxylase family protein [Candidatus Limnocylindria bacterium]